MNIKTAFTEHPASVNETYFEHMGQAFSFGFPMLVASFACILHGLFPFLFTSTGSQCIARLHDRMVVNRVTKPAPVPAHGAVAPGE